MTYPRKRKEPTVDTPNLADFKALLPEIRKGYTDYLDSKFPKAVALEAYQKGATKGRPDFIAENIPLSKVVQLAYPVLKYDINNKPMDNRDQPCIDAVDGFSKTVKSKKQPLTQEEVEIELATRVYASLSSLENSINDLERKERMLVQGGFSPDDVTESLKYDFEYIAKCEGQLNKALKELSKTLDSIDTSNPFVAELKSDIASMKGYEKLFHQFTSPNAGPRAMYEESNTLTTMFKGFCQKMEALRPANSNNPTIDAENQLNKRGNRQSDLPPKKRTYC